MTDYKELIERLEAPDYHDPTCPFSKHCYCDDNVHDRVRDDDKVLAAQALRDLTAENERLNKRLETEPEWGEQADGIACRDDTIKLLDEKIARLKARGDGLAELVASAEDILGPRATAALAAWETRDAFPDA